MDEERTIAQLEQQIKLNQEIISNLKEFFGSYLSNFLKEYRNEKSEHDDILKKDLSRQDAIYEWTVNDMITIHGSCNIYVN